MKKKKILFVCNGNVFRSFSAEKLLKEYLKKNNIKGWVISSAGVTARKQPIKPEIISTIKELGVKKTKHKQRKLTKRILKKQNITIAMAKDHLKYIKDKGYTNVYLFNELSTNKKTSILDIHEEIKDYKTNPKKVSQKIEKTIKEINAGIPKLFQVISRKLEMQEK